MNISPWKITDRAVFPPQVGDQPLLPRPSRSFQPGKDTIPEYYLLTTVSTSKLRNPSGHTMLQGGRTRQLCDMLGDAGYLVLLPDFFRGEWRVGRLGLRPRDL